MKKILLLTAMTSVTSFATDIRTIDQKLAEVKAQYAVLSQMKDQKVNEAVHYYQAKQDAAKAYAHYSRAQMDIAEMDRRNFFDAQRAAGAVLPNAIPSMAEFVNHPMFLERGKYIPMPDTTARQVPVAPNSPMETVELGQPIFSDDDIRRAGLEVGSPIPGVNQSSAPQVIPAHGTNAFIEKVRKNSPAPQKDISQEEADQLNRMEQQRMLWRKMNDPYS
jgi:hypothetical protein